MSSLFKLPYATIFQYLPRGESQAVKRSQKLTGYVKAARINILDSILESQLSEQSPVFQPFLNKEVTLVPIPTSSLLSKGQLWPSMEFAQFLLNNGLSMDVLPCLKRKIPIRKSSLCFSADTRPTVIEHIESLHLTQENNGIIQPRQITLIDDLLTLGRTAAACAFILKESFPEAVIRVLGIVRTQGFTREEDFMSYAHSVTGELTLYSSYNTFITAGDLFPPNPSKVEN